MKFRLENKLYNDCEIVCHRQREYELSFVIKKMNTQTKHLYNKGKKN